MHNSDILRSVRLSSVRVLMDAE